MSPLSKWFFSLDELDVLELTYQALIDSPHAEKKYRDMEEKILAEQEALEESSESALEKMLINTPMNEECPLHHHRDDPNVSVDDLLQTSLVRDNVLAATAYHFFRLVNHWASQRTAMDCYEDFFRIKINAPLIPAKLAFAAVELEHGDAASVMIAEKELDVARVYVSQLLASCEAMRKEEQMLAKDAALFLIEGEALLASIVAERDRLRLLLAFSRL